SKYSGPSDPTGEQRMRDAARALADAAGQFGQSFGAAGTQAEAGVTKGLLAAAQALAQASAWVEQRSRPRSTKERLLEQAARLFAERGYAGVSLEDIAQAAGFTKGAVYSHFGSKEQTFLAALREATEALSGVGVPQHDPVRDRTGAPEAAQEAGAEQQRELSEQHAAIARAVTLSVEAMLFGQRVPGRREEVREIVSALLSAIAEADRRLGGLAGAAERELDRDESQVAALTFRTLLLGLNEAAG
ncbi:TetR/AcrR family transcriptional regulator, partial [Leucobacter sp. BZR 635]